MVESYKIISKVFKHSSIRQELDFSKQFCLLIFLFQIDKVYFEVITHKI